MEQATRFELRLSVEQRRGLDALAHETGLSAADLVRLGLTQLLRKGVVLRGDAPHATQEEN
jgi:hypothetical protein